MTGRARAFALMVLAWLATECRAKDSDDLLPPPGFADPPARVLRPQPSRAHSPQFGAGFYDREVSPTASWRWMGKAGHVSLPWPGNDGRLRITGWAPIELLGAPPTLTVTVAGHMVDSFVAPSAHFTREWIIGRATFGDGARAELVIEASATTRAPGDARVLGFAVESLEWDSVPTR